MKEIETLKVVLDFFAIGPKVIDTLTAEPKNQS